MSDSTKLSPGESLLVAAPAEWRESCLSVPALRALRRMGLELEILCPEHQAGFWSASGFDRTVTYSAKTSARELARALSGRATVLLWEAGTAADACAKAGVPRRIGPPVKGLARRLTEPVTVIRDPGPVEHRVQFYLEIAAKLGAEAMVAENFAPVVVDVPKATDRVLLVPDSDLGAHYEWPLERWESVATGLLERGWRLVIATAGPKGAALAARVAGAEELKLVAPALEDLASCALCVVADGGLPHLAAHVGTDCVVLFGPGEPRWMRPLGRRHAIARRKAECAPCHAPKCRMDLRCQNDLEVADVLRHLPVASA